MGMCTKHQTVEAVFGLWRVGRNKWHVPVIIVSPSTSKPSTVGGRIIQTLAEFIPLPPIVQCWPVGEVGWLQWTNQIKPLTIKHLFTETTLKSGCRGGELPWWFRVWLICPSTVSPLFLQSSSKSSWTSFFLDPMPHPASHTKYFQPFHWWPWWGCPCWWSIKV